MRYSMHQLRALSSRLSARRAERGYALIVAIWITGLAALIVAGFTLSMRAHLRGAAITTDLAGARALADAGVSLAVLDFAARHTDPSSTPRFGDGRATTCSAGDGRLFVSVQDTAGLVDINWASEALLGRLLAGIGVAPEQARSLAAAIVDYRDTDNVVTPGGAEAEEYKTSGAGKRPKNAPFESTAELDQVLGIDGELATRLMPHVTVHSLLSGIDPEAARRDLIELLHQGAQAMPASAVGAMSSAAGSGGGPLQADLASTSLRRAYSVHAEARVGRVVFVREAVISFTPGGPRAHKVLRWSQGQVWPAGSAEGARDIGDCREGAAATRLHDAARYFG